MDILEVNRNTCRQDGICAEICPQGLIAFQKNDYPKPTAATEEWCLRCGHCVAVCPTGSLTHRDMPVEQCPPVIKKARKVNYENLEHFLKSRRSIRVYQNKPVPRDVLVRLIETARYGPTGSNRQDVAWLVVDDRDKLRRLTDICADWMRSMVKSNSPAAPFMSRILKRQESGVNELLRDAPALIIAHAGKGNPLAIWSAAIALTNFDLAANSLGLGCCCIGFMVQAANAYPPMREALSLPEGNEACGCLIAGYPKYSYHRIPLRKPPKITWC